MDIDGPGIKQAIWIIPWPHAKDRETVSLKLYKTASCAEIAGNYSHHWINVTREKVAKNGPDLKKLEKQNQTGESGVKRKKP